MVKKLLVFLFMIFAMTAQAQKIERVEVKGSIFAPEGDDVEGISIYNVSSQQGVVTNANGDFAIEVGINDRVQVTALQFQSFTVIVDEGVINNKLMRIFLNPAVNQLEEVVVRPSDLTGNIMVDVKRIKTFDINFGLDLTYETMEFDYDFAPDGMSSIPGNAATEAFYNGQRQWGMNFVGLAGLLFGKKSSKGTREFLEDKEVLLTALWQRYPDSYMADTFGIPSEQVNEFRYFVEDNGLTRKMMKSENEVLLIQYLFKQSELYKERIEEK